MITLEYFAILKDQCGLSYEEIHETYESPKEVYAHLKIKYGFSLKEDQIMVAINDEFASWETPLHSGDKLVFIPPVAGG